MSRHERPDPDHIRLEAFATSRAISFLQALTVRSMVRDESQSLVNSYPGVVTGYQGRSSSQQRIRKLGVAPEIQAYLVYGAKRAIGLATIIPDQRLIHPDEGTIKGNDLDYWLRSGSPTRTHRAVLLKLLSGQVGEQVFSTVATNDHQYIAKRLNMDQYMTAVGEPTFLAAPPEGDRFNVARAGQEAQVYQWE